MDWVNQMIYWFQVNWGVAVFGTVSLGSIVTTAVLLFKQWVGTKVIGTKYESMWESAQNALCTITDLYNAEKDKVGKVELQNIFMQQAQNVLMDTVIKMALSSKMDTDDKQSIVANVERLKLLAPKEVVAEIKKEVKEAGETIVTEINENPAQAAMDMADAVGTLLDKYKE